MTPQWLVWAQRLQALAQSGLTFTQNPFEVERYEGIRRIAAEMMAASADMPIEKIEGLFADKEGYATPQIDVRGAVFDAEDRILLVKERNDGRWTLPGGFADVGLSGGENVVKEIREESGNETRAIRLLAAYDRSKHPHPIPYAYPIYKLFFLCELIGGAPQASIETEDVGFFPIDALPPLSLGRVLPEHIERMLALRNNPQAPADFD